MFYRSSHQRCSIKKAVLKNFARFTGKHLRWSLFLLTLLRRGSNTSAFPRILQNFEKHLFRKTSVNDCFLFCHIESFRNCKRFELFWSTTLLKRDSNTGVFLWILRNFLKHLFWRTSVNYCFLFCFIESFRSGHFVRFWIVLKHMSFSKCVINAGIPPNFFSRYYFSKKN